MTSSQIEKGKVVEKHALYDRQHHGKKVCMFAKVEVADGNPTQDEAADVWVIKNGNGHKTVTLTIEEEFGRRAHLRLETLKGEGITSPNLVAAIPTILALENYTEGEIDLTETLIEGEVLEMAHFVRDGNTDGVMHVQAAA